MNYDLWSAREAADRGPRIRTYIAASFPGTLVALGAALRADPHGLSNDSIYDCLFIASVHATAAFLGAWAALAMGRISTMVFMFIMLGVLSAIGAAVDPCDSIPTWRYIYGWSQLLASDAIASWSALLVLTRVFQISATFDAHYLMIGTKEQFSVRSLISVTTLAASVLGCLRVIRDYRLGGAGLACVILPAIATAIVATAAAMTLLAHRITIPRLAVAIGMPALFCFLASWAVGHSYMHYASHFGMLSVVVATDFLIVRALGYRLVHVPESEHFNAS